ncbi:MAG: Phosphohistidine phosphatase SixA [Myxococcales bacterium]|nr:Phosphohistidine phosphatase SixA [Myxococcales bacterium]
MHLFVIRHAIAEDVAPGGDDADRKVTSSGERKFKRVVRGLRALGWHFDRVLSSPWARAARTAELLAPVSDGTPITTPLLTEPPRPELLAMIAESSSPAKRHATALVGHEPWLGELVSLLVYGDTVHGEPLLLKKGGVIWVQGSSVAGGMMLRALLPPGLLRQLR